jgi:signal transduction histidine kinase
MAASLSHHLNNALTGVIGNLELGLRNLPPNSELAGHLQASLACACQAADVVKRIVSFACRAPGPRPMAPVNLSDLVRQALEHLGARLAPNIQVTLAESVPAQAWACETVVLTILEQVLLNAIEAMPKGGTLSVAVEEGLESHSVLIRDSGVGIALEVQAHLFEPFQTTKPSGHLGLGLVLCREMIAAQGASLEISSTPGQGTTVSLTFLAVVESGISRTSESPAPRLDASQALPASPHQPMIAHQVSGGF